MKRVLRLSSGLALLACFSLNAAVLAEDEQLDLARGLFEMQEYVAAHEALVEVDPDTLGEDEAKVYDELLKALPEAIRGSAKAKQDQADAKKAYDEGRWTEADQLYARVIENDYAQVILQTEARTQRQRIAEKLELSEAAKPTGPVPDEAEPAVQEPQSEPEAEQRPAEEVKPVAESAEPIPEPTERAAQPTPRRRTLMDDLRVRDDLLWQRAVAKMQEAINKALLETGGNREKAAELLGIGRKTLYRKLKQYNIE